MAVQQHMARGSAVELVDDVIGKTLASIPRSDQRRWGEIYVRGLLSTEGKKTVRNLANWAGRGFEQNLHQFISKSPWDSGPVRQALAGHVHLAAPPRAWVVRPLVLTKMGRHSVGVERQFIAEYGRVVNCQKGVGVWLANDELSCPVDWRIALPAGWTEEPELRRRAGIPELARAESPEQCAVMAVVKMAVGWGLPRCPVVMDLRETDPRYTFHQLTRHQIPFVARVADPAQLFALKPRALGDALGSHHAAPAVRLTSALRQRRLPIEWLDHTTGKVRTTVAGSTAVQLMDHSPRSPRPNEEELVLIGAWTDPGGRRPHEYWLTNLPRLQLGRLYRTAMLSHRVERDLTEVSDPLGLRDFEGRSYPGWHHHMTMVSLAHAVTVLAGSAAQAAPA